MSLFKRSTPKKSETDTDQEAVLDSRGMSPDRESLNIAEMIRDELKAETADSEQMDIDDVHEVPFDGTNETLDTEDNILSLAPRDAILTPADSEDDVSIDDIRKNILRITEDWRLASASQKIAEEEDDPIALRKPIEDLAHPGLETPVLSTSAPVGEDEEDIETDGDDEFIDLDILDADEEGISTAPELEDYEHEAFTSDVSEHSEHTDRLDRDEVTDVSLDEVTDVSLDDEAENAPSLTAEGLNLGELRLDIARISSDIDNGEALYRRAQQRVTSLMGFIEKAEVAVSVLNRLQPENRKLISKNRSLETDVEAQKYIIASLENDRTKLRDSLDQATNREETLRSQFTELKAILEERNRENEALLTEADANQMQIERIKTNLEIANRENATLNERMTDLSQHIQRLSEEKINIEKTLAAAKADLNDEIDKNNSLEAENSELRISLRTSNRHNSEMHNELMEVQDKITIYKTQHETHLHRRDDRIIVLESRIKELEKIIKHKDEIVQTKTDSVAALKKTISRHEIEREKLEKIVEDQNYQLSKAEEELLASQHDIAELDQQYKDLAKALSRRPASTKVERRKQARMERSQLSMDDITKDDDDEDPTPLKVSA